MMPHLGIIAGGGTLPRKLIEACLRDQKSFFVLAIKGQTDGGLLRDIPHAWTRLGATDEAIRILKEQHVDTIVMAGAVRRPALTELRPDWRTLRVFTQLGMAALGDDALLRAIMRELESEGFQVIGAHDIEPDLITPAGILTKKMPSESNNADMDYGLKAVRMLGQLDIGQAVVVQQGIVLGVEAIEGTDALLERCKKLRRKGNGGILVKACKPQQDKRLDLPTIGLRTIKNVYEAGLEGIAIEAGASLLLDRDAVVDAANSLGIFVTGFKS